MPGDMMSTKEVSEYLGIHEKQVYSLIKDGKIPCTRLTGKWVFPRRLIDEWILNDARGSLATLEGSTIRTRGALLASGSNDPVLDVLLSEIKQDGSGFYIFSCNTGSTDGLRLLEAGLTDIAWCHLFDPSTGAYNIPIIAERFSGKKIVVVHLFYRDLGLVLAPEMADRVRTFPDLASEGVRFINRQAGSGTRIFLDYNLHNSGINPLDIKGYDQEVYTHFEVGLAIVTGRANAGLATGAVSRMLSLPFVSLVHESFDMVVTQEIFFNKNVQTFIGMIQSEGFRQKVESLGAYDFEQSGKIIYTPE